MLANALRSFFKLGWTAFENGYFPIFLAPAWNLPGSLLTKT